MSDPSGRAWNRLHRRKPTRRWLSVVFVGLLWGGVACGGSPSTPEATDTENSDTLPSTDLIFNNITLEQSDDQGLLRWRVIADQAIYSQDQRDAVIERPLGELFQTGNQREPAFSIEAEQGEVKQDGKRLFLNGDVVITDEETGAVIRGDEMRWVPEDNTVVLRGNVSSSHPDFKMTANRVTVWIDEDRVEVRGNVKAETTEDAIAFNGEAVEWFINDDRIVSDRPVRFQQQDGDDVVARAQGNAITYDLADQVATLTDDAVVVMQDPAIRVTGNALEWDQTAETVTADERVNIYHREEKINLVADQGWGNLAGNQTFYMNGNVVITAERNQARLRSDDLTWTLPSQRVVAEGNVVYRQADPVFNLKGPKAVGRLEDETIVVSGGRVVTEVIPGS